MTTNQTRADRAADALAAYTLEKGGTIEDTTDGIVDLISDLLHLSARYAVEDGGDVESYVEKALKLARIHFEAEHNNPEEEVA